MTSLFLLLITLLMLFCLCACYIQEVSDVMEQQRHLMKCVLDDSRLNRLRLEGGTVLARIRREEACENDNYKYVRLSVQFIHKIAPKRIQSNLDYS